MHVIEIDDGNYYLHVFEDNVYSLYVHEDDYLVCFVVQKPRSNGLTFDFEKTLKITCLKKKTSQLQGKVQCHFYLSSTF